MMQHDRRIAEQESPNKNAAPAKRAALHLSYCYNVGVSYYPFQSPFGTVWVHPCPPLDSGPDWARRARLVVDAGPKDSHLTFQGRSIPFHGHLFRELDGAFRFSERDRQKYPAELLDALELVISA